MAWAPLASTATTTETATTTPTGTAGGAATTAGTTTDERWEVEVDTTAASTATAMPAEEMTTSGVEGTMEVETTGAVTISPGEEVTTSEGEDVTTSEAETTGAATEASTTESRTMTASTTMKSTTTSKTTSTTQSITSVTSTTSEHHAWTSCRILGSIELSFASFADDVRDGPDAEKVLSAVGVTIAQVVGMPTRSYVSTWFAESRRLRVADRRLSDGTLVVEYSIEVPADAAAGVPDVAAAKASLDSVDVGSLTSQLQDNIDAEVGDGVYSVSVLSITAAIVDDPDTTLAATAASDEASSLPVVVIGVVSAVVFCFGCGFPVSAFVLMRRRAARRAAPGRVAQRGPEGMFAVGSSMVAGLADEPPKDAEQLPSLPSLPEDRTDDGRGPQKSLPEEHAQRQKVTADRRRQAKAQQDLQAKDQEALCFTSSSWEITIPEFPMVPEIPPTLHAALPGNHGMGMLSAAPGDWGTGSRSNPTRQIIRL